MGASCSHKVKSRSCHQSELRKHGILGSAAAKEDVHVVYHSKEGPEPQREGATPVDHGASFVQGSGRIDGILQGLGRNPSPFLFFSSAAACFHFFSARRGQST